MASESIYDGEGQAEEKLGRNYDLVISDIGRPMGQPSGRELGSFIAGRDEPRPFLIYYVTDLKPEMGTPPEALGITNRPDHLLHFVLDAVERAKFTERAESKRGQ